jgi:hypothetical protein
MVTTAMQLSWPEQQMAGIEDQLIQKLSEMENG